MEKGKDTRVQIANDTGLAPSAIWRLIGELEDEELVEVVDVSKRKGRKSALYAPKSSFVSSVIYNVEVLETLVGVGFLDGSWKIVDKFETSKDFGQFKSLAIESFKSIGEIILSDMVLHGLSFRYQEWSTMRRNS